MFTQPGLINTEDEFYNSEQDYFDNANPVYSGFREKLYSAILNSKFSDELFDLTGRELYNIAKVYKKTFSPEVVEDMKTENKGYNNHDISELLKKGKSLMKQLQK